MKLRQLLVLFLVLLLSGCTGTETPETPVDNTELTTLTVSEDLNIVREVHSEYPVFTNLLDALDENQNQLVITEDMIDSEQVDMNVLGFYDVFYYFDYAGLEPIEVTLTVEVVDTTAPVIDLNGSDEVFIILGNTYSELGASVEDNYDDEIEVEIEGFVDTSEVGDYYIDYTAEDSSGNSVTVQRLVHIVDVSSPIINVDISTIYVEFGDDLDLPHCFVTDNVDDLECDFDLSHKNLEHLGSFRVYVNAVDSSGNEADPKSFLVVIQDTTAPVIEIESNYLEVRFEEALPEIICTAKDIPNEDAPCDFNLLGDTNTLGYFDIVITATDESGNVSAAEIVTVYVFDDIAPEIVLYNVTEFAELGEDYVVPSCTATDNASSATCSIDDSEVDTSKLGLQNVYYLATDESGNTSNYTFTFEVVDTIAPVVDVDFLEMDYIIGTNYVEPVCTVDDQETLNCQVLGDVDTTTAGSYQLEYYAIDSSGNRSDTVYVVVYVYLPDAPVITVNSEPIVHVEYLENFTIPTATYSEANGNTGSVTDITGTVDVNSLGTYVITYNYTTSYGLSAQEKTVTVIVEDTTAPIITTPQTPITIEQGIQESIPVCTATDDHGVTECILDDSEFNLEPAGLTFKLYYYAFDATGNKSDILEVIVNIVDTSTPELTLVGDETIFIEYGQSFTDDGVALFDDFMPSHELIYSTDTVNVFEVGTYVITYSYVDDGGNIAETITRTIHVEDHIFPEVFVDDSPITIELGESVNIPNCTASDNADTVECLIDDSERIENDLGVYTIYFSATDLSGNKTTIEVVVTIEDTTLPINTTDLQDVTIQLNDEYTLPICTFTDNDHLALCDVEGEVDINSPGTYAVTYTVTDRTGNKDIGSITVTVEDNTQPILTTDMSPVTISLGDEYNVPSCEFTDNDALAECTTQAQGTLSDPGEYSITFTVTDRSGNYVTDTKIITITDTVSPVLITPIDDVYVELGDSYTLPTCDFTDNDEMASCNVTTNFDITTPGDYIITFTITDRVGNITVGNKNIYVYDITAPILTTDLSPITIEKGTPYNYPACEFTDNDPLATCSVTSDVDVNNVGTYTVTYTVTDRGLGYTEATKTITVEDTTAPSLSGENTVVTNNGEFTLTFDEPIAMYSTNSGSTWTSITPSTTVNITGLTYWRSTTYFKDIYGNQTGRVYLYVDTVAPVIELNYIPFERIIEVYQPTDYRDASYFGLDVAIDDEYYYASELDPDEKNIYYITHMVSPYLREVNNDGPEWGGGAGNDIAVSGNYIVSLDSSYDLTDDERGSRIYVYSTANTNYERIIRPGDIESGGRFGNDMAVYGDYIYVTGLDNKIYIYKLSNPFYESVRTIPTTDAYAMPDAVAAYGDYFAVNAAATISGVETNVVYLYRFSDPSFQRMISPDFTISTDRFGYEIDIDGDYIIISSVNETYSETYGDAVYVYKISDENYERVIQPTSPWWGDEFGKSIAIHGDYIVVGAPGDDNPYGYTGYVYIFKVSDENFEQRIEPEAGINGSGVREFGYSVDIYNGKIIIGAPYILLHNGLPEKKQGIIFLYEIKDYYDLDITETHDITLEIYKDGVLIPNTFTLTEPGTYVITATDEVGNTTTETFIIE